MAFDLPPNLPFDLSPWLALGWTVTEWTIRLLMLIYVPQRRSPAAARTWLLLIFFVPVIGLALYALVGRVYYPKHRRKKLEQINLAIIENRPRLHHLTAEPVGDDKSLMVSRLIERAGSFPPLLGNRIELLDDYEGTIQAIVGDIDEAKHHVHILVYIFAPDVTGRTIVEALLRARERGVSCKLLLDGIGARRGLWTFGPELRAAGVEVIEVLPPSAIISVLTGRRARLDLRNHRKIFVIDGRIGYIGSQNIIDASATTPGLLNEELVARVRGPAVFQLQTLFFADRTLETGEDTYDPAYYPPAQIEGGSIAQLIPSGPGYGTHNAHMALVSLIHHAKKRVVITTPYFVPDESFLEALRVASFRGVNVHIVLSKTIDQAFTQAAQEAYYATLLRSGVHLHLYRPAFLHAKHVTIDDEVAMIGSANMDIRSFTLNAEAALVIYDSAVVAHVASIQAQYLANSDQVFLEDWERRPLLRKAWQNLCRLADAVL